MQPTSSTSSSPLSADHATQAHAESSSSSNWSNASSPTESESNFLDEDDDIDNKRDSSEGDEDGEFHNPPVGNAQTTSSYQLSSSSSANYHNKNNVLAPLASIPTSNSKPYNRTSSPTPMPSRQRVRGLGLTPLTSLPPAPQHVNMPKSQPLSRALFARMASTDTPHAGMKAGSGKSGSKTQKIIVPTKSFRTTFELGLSASELARR